MRMWLPSADSSVVARLVRRRTRPVFPSISTRSLGRNGWRIDSMTEATKFSTVSRTAKLSAMPTIPAAPSSVPSSAVAPTMSSATTAPPSQNAICTIWRRMAAMNWLAAIRANGWRRRDTQLPASPISSAANSRDGQQRQERHELEQAIAHPHQDRLQAGAQVGVLGHLVVDFDHAVDAGGQLAQPVD